MYQPSVKSIHKTNHLANTKHTYTNFERVSPFSITPVNNVCFFKKKKTGQGQKECMLFQEENRARPETMDAFSRRKQGKASNKV